MASQDFLWAGTKHHMAKVEALYATDPTPVIGTDDIEFQSLKIKPAAEVTERQAVRATAASPGSTIQRISYDIEAQLAVAGPIVVTDVEWDFEKLAPACRFAQEDVGGPPVTSKVYTPNSLIHGSCTIWEYMFGDNQANSEIIKLNGCVFVPKLVFPAGGDASWALSGKGLYTIHTNDTKPTPGSIDYLHPGDSCPSRGFTMAIDSRDDQNVSAEIDFGWEIGARAAHGETYGLKGWVLKRARSPRITVSPEAVFTSTYDPATKALANTTFAFSLTADTLGGGRIVVAAPAAQWESPPVFDEGDGVLLAPGVLVCADSTDEGDDSISVTCSRTP